MLKKATRDNHVQIMEYLKEEMAINTFLVGDIEIYGYENDFQHIYLESEDNQIKSIMLFYYHSAVFYCKENRKVDIYLPLLEKYQSKVLNGKLESLENFKNYLSNYQNKEMYFLELKSFNLDLKPNKIVKTMKTIEEVEQNYELRKLISEFSTEEKQFYINKTWKNIQNNFTKVFFIEENDKIIASAGISPNCREIGMVVSVMCHPNYRNKGYATDVLIELCNYAKENKQLLSLFYDNPNAGKIYRKLGFTDAGNYLMMQKK